MSKALHITDIEALCAAVGIEPAAVERISIGPDLARFDVIRSEGGFARRLTVVVPVVHEPRSAQ